MEKKLAVVALGGNALLRGNQKGTIEEQNANTVDTLENLIYLIKEGYNLIISHGNGPQVGNILMSDDAGVKMYGLPPMTLDMCVAYSQGEIGYMIERNLRNILREHGLTRHVVSMISQVVVDEHRHYRIRLNGLVEFIPAKKPINWLQNMDGFLKKRLK